MAPKPEDVNGKNVVAVLRAWGIVWPVMVIVAMAGAWYFNTVGLPDQVRICTTQNAIQDTEIRMNRQSIQELNCDVNDIKKTANLILLEVREMKGEMKAMKGRGQSE